MLFLISFKKAPLRWYAMAKLFSVTFQNSSIISGGNYFYKIYTIKILGESVSNVLPPNHLHKIQLFNETS